MPLMYTVCVTSTFRIRTYLFLFWGCMLTNSTVAVQFIYAEGQPLGEE